MISSGVSSNQPSGLSLSRPASLAPVDDVPSDKHRARTRKTSGVSRKLRNFYAGISEASQKQLSSGERGRTSYMTQAQLEIKSVGKRPDRCVVASREIPTFGELDGEADDNLEEEIPDDVPVPGHPTSCTNSSRTVPSDSSSKGVKHLSETAPISISSKSILSPPCIRPTQFPTKNIINHRIGPDDLRANIMLHDRHLEIWDADDDILEYAWPAYLHLVCNDFSLIDLVGTPDVSLISIECKTLTSSLYNTDGSKSYTVSYNGSMIIDTTDIVHGHGIQIEPKWVHTLNQKGDFETEKQVNTRNEHPRSPRRSEFYEAGFWGWDSWGWYLKFWIPIPMSMFAKMESRMFKIDAQVLVGDYSQLLCTSVEMSVSHLRKEKEMV